MMKYTVCFCFRRRFGRSASNDAPVAIKEVFGQYSAEGGVMGPEELRRFMEEVQGGGTGDSAQGIIDALKSEPKHLKLLHRKGLSIDGFYRFLFSDENAAIPPRSEVHQNMEDPLSHYFIYTGHNSYLTGNQLNSECSDVPIIQALERGVRVIELDLWPNSTKDNVDVLHGGTLTPPVELIKCLRSIKKHAFVASEYPVIITFEDHLTADLQAVVADMLVETFGEMLYQTDQSDSVETFPSPAGLKKRILISTKPPNKYSKTKLHIQEIKHQEDPQGKKQEEKKRKRKNKKKKKKKKKQQQQQQQQQQGDEEKWSGDASDHDDLYSSHKVLRERSEHSEEEEEEEDARDDAKAHHVAVTEYEHLIAIPAKKLIRGDLESSLKIDPQRATRLSLSELALEKAALSHGPELIRFTQRNLLRIYPKGSRVTSSNYKPLLGWTHGAQMVALNMQGHGKALWLMQGMFRANGGCGYVRKPDILLDDDPDRLFYPIEKYPPKTTLKVRVYTGDGWRFDYGKHDFDTFSPPDFYTRVGIAGVPADTVPMKRTRAIEDNWTPAWDQEFEFKLTVPELALLRIEVYEYDMSDKDDFAGQTCLPVWELRTGIRSVRLCNDKGETMPSVKLLMRFQFV